MRGYRVMRDRHREVYRSCSRRAYHDCVDWLNRKIRRTGTLEEFGDTLIVSSPNSKETYTIELFLEKSFSGVAYS